MVKCAKIDCVYNGKNHKCTCKDVRFGTYSGKVYNGEFKEFWVCKNFELSKEAESIYASIKEYINEHPIHTTEITDEEWDNINVSELKDVLPGACFHGEVWVKCPYCGNGMEVMGYTTRPRKNGYHIYRCYECGKLCRDR